MLEQSLRELFGQQAEVEPPPGRVTIADLIRQGRLRRRRRRRLRAIGTPALAAVAAAAIAVGSSNLSAGSHSAGLLQGGATATARQFSALSPYATFGWLPATAPVVPRHKKVLADLNKEGTTGWIDEASESLNSGPWSLQVYAIGACHQVGNQLHCGNNNPAWTAADQRAMGVGRYITPNFCAFSREVLAPPVNGHRAFWLARSGTQCLNWEYAPGGWATMYHFNEIRPGKQLVLRIASAVRFGGHQPSLKFPAQLRELPGKWRVVRAEFAHGFLVSRGYTIGDGAASIDIEATPTNSKHNKCGADHTPQRPGAAVRGCRVINGYYVSSIKTPTPLKKPSCHRGSACANPVNLAQISALDADSLYVSLTPANPRYFGLLFKVFTHMKMLGKNPAAWTTQPIS